MDNAFEHLKAIDKQLKEKEAAENAAKGSENPPAGTQAVAETTVVVDDEAEKAAKLAAEEAEKIAKAAAAASPGPIVPDAEEEKFKGKSYDEIILEKEAAKAEAKRLEILEKANGNPVAKLVLDAVEKGEDVIKVLSAVQTAKPEDYSDKDLFLMTLSESERAGDTEELFEAFNTMPESVRRTLIEGKRNELKTQYESVLNGLKSQDRQIEDLMRTVPEGINSRVKSLVGTKIGEVEITPNIAVKIAERAFRDAVLPDYRKGGNFDFDGLISDVTEVIMAPAYKRMLVDSVKKETTAAAFEAIHSPSGQDSPMGSAPVPKTKLEQDLAALNKFAESSNPFKKKN